jgi:hypothetical protein
MARIAQVRIWTSSRSCFAWFEALIEGVFWLRAEDRTRCFAGKPAPVARQHGHGMLLRNRTDFRMAAIDGEHPAVAFDILLSKDSDFDGIRKGERGRSTTKPFQEMGFEALVHPVTSMT